MRFVGVSLVLLCVFARSSASQQTGAAIQTPIDQWRPVRPGTWTVTSTRTDSRSGQPPAVTTTSACPYPALLFLNKLADIPIGESGCRYNTYQLSDPIYHIVAQCRALRGGDHFETTTLRVAEDGRQFTAATSWSGSSGSVTLQREGKFVADCNPK